MRHQPRPMSAGVARILPLSIRLNFRRAAADVDIEQNQTLLTALRNGHPSHAAAIVVSSAGPAVAQTNRPASSENSSAIFCALSPPRGLTGDNHRARVDILARQSAS